MRYVLLKMPSGEIRIIDNSTYTGKRRVEYLCKEGAVSAGTLVSTLDPMSLRQGIGLAYINERDVALERLRKIQDFVLDNA